ncbi:HAD-IB family phosphatase [Streptomyces sp. B-S-A8]|uniref:phosphoserine phosphatase n=1 Tax=Streptomyces solicavernae TaxID=3043614 RepID=A0ABT6S245_9ACTN|nr:HAD-IB family phosphatase [Streptomyces sp. B-S-A8]MDI3390756.1 HAD-IB family phosphatase [Streptomyces sp. B-S-A8]
MTEPLHCPHAAPHGPRALPTTPEGHRRLFDAVIADVDDTLTLDNSAAELLTALGIPQQRLTDLIRESESGQISQAIADQRLLTLLTSRGGRVHRTAVENVFSKIRLRPLAAPVIRGFQQAGLRAGLISASFNTYVEHMAARLGLTDWYSNVQLGFDDTDTLTSVDFTIDAAALKHRQLHDFCARHRLHPSRVLVAGDSRYDLQMFACTGHGVLMASPNNTQLRPHAWQVIDRIDELATLTAALNPAE